MSEEQDKIIELEKKIANLKNIQSELKESERRYKSIVETTHDAIYIYNRKGKLVFINKAACELHGMERDELLAKDPKKFIHPDSIRVFYHFISTLERGNKFKGFAQGLRKDGSIRDVEIYGCPITFNGELHYYSSVRDITELRHSQAALEQAKIKAEKASRSKDEFLAIMSHEMQTPLNPILGYLTMLETSLEDEEQLELIQRMRNSSQRLHAVIKDILYYSGIDNSEDHVEIETCLLRSLASEALASVKDHNNNQLLIQPGITSVGESKEKSGNQLINLDRNRLLQALSIILANACKFTKQGQITLAYAYLEDQNLNHNLVFEVQDNGVGIEADKLEAIFHPFTQADASFTRDYEGIGLGLAICRRLIEQLEGDIEVESEINKGSLFRISLTVEPAK
jgi:PAS domain S-box-containing protein